MSPAFSSPAAATGRASVEPHREAPQALIFDCDGTLADSMPLHWLAWQQIIRRHQFVFSEDRFYALGGIPSRDILRELQQEQGLTLDPLIVAREKEEAYLELLPRIQPIPEVIAIAQAHFGKVPLGVASGGSRSVIRRVLLHLGIADLFAAVVTNEDVQRQKPAPDIFLKAAQHLGVVPERCRAYEDTELGLRAIHAAGMEAIDVRGLRIKTAS